jgi:hypothetical protein
MVPGIEAALALVSIGSNGIAATPEYDFNPFVNATHMRRALNENDARRKASFRCQGPGRAISNRSDQWHRRSSHRDASPQVTRGQVRCYRKMPQFQYYRFDKSNKPQIQKEKLHLPSCATTAAWHGAFEQW